MSAPPIDTIRAVAQALTDAADAITRLDSIKGEIAAAESTVLAAEQRAQSLETAFTSRFAQYQAQEAEHQAKLDAIDGERDERLKAADIAAAAILAQAKLDGERLISEANEVAEQARNATRVAYAQHEAGLADLEARRKAAEQVITNEQQRLTDIRGDVATEQAKLDAIRAAIAAAKGI